MNLIAYSDSEDSDNEAPSAPTLTAKSTPKPAFQKVVDSANPGKIKVNLPGASRVQVRKDDIDVDAPPAKKARMGGGGFGGFNSMLPAPKMPNATVAGGDASGKRGLGKGLGAGVNLKTGAEPAFKREPKINYDEDRVPLQKEDFRAMLNLPPPKTEAPAAAKSDVAEATLTPIPASKPATKPKPRFVPMSVGRGKKRKPAAPRPVAETIEKEEVTSSPTTISSATEPQPPKPAARPKVSLFSISQEQDSARDQSSGVYQPLLHGVGEDEEAEVPDKAFDEANTFQPASIPVAGNSAQSRTLTNIASELNLSEAERRQLFGRKGNGGPDFSSASILEFNTDTEYAHNEQLRQQGETVQHNALKSISGTGKNSLKSLISAATTQKDALEEHFAAGRRNKREAGSKYGW
ncbi:hypothetical protein K504DRAFT_456761 [Pleomassaria siparia CBS 279.74]|uniref:Mitotic checkpoint regulator, MAD2B-interacting-domain-containing protein n=1 Tax=Pleomassaria siparia CBS 279.74 TaxID=1314801 RepID=A0A6G1KNW9_9PLEO|nr:hypothetical protein K504DRAFT_456761 [Pleomassaria siparia CBS 279.74]